MAPRINLIVQLSILVLLLCSQYCLAADKTENAKKPEGKNILFFTVASTYSMRIAIWPLIEALTEKGHRVTFVSSQPPKVPDPRVTDIAPKKVQEWFNSFAGELDFIAFRKSGENRLGYYTLMKDFQVAACEAFYSDEEAVKWIRTAKFDLIVVDSVNECAYGLAHYFKAKMVTYSTLTVCPWFFDTYGMQDDSSWASDMPHYFPPFAPTFFTRMVTAVNQLVFQYLREYSYFPALEEITRKGLGKLGVDKIPSFKEFDKNVSLVFVTTHYAQEYARSFPPNMIPIGGLALTGKVKPLPKEFEDFINKGKNGFIVMSFGSALDVAKLRKEQRDIIINALLQFPDIQFIWKAADVGVKLPENFMLSKWVPQQDLLAHPKIKGFITHGGLGSVTEAVYNGVPMIGFPLLYDQDYNTNFLEPKGIGLSVEVSTLTTEQFKDAIWKIVNDPKYQTNMKKVSRLFKDRPMTPLNTAVWWIEFALRHETEEITEYMQSRSVHQSWWVRRQLDVWLFLAIVAALIVFIPSYILFKLLRMIFGRSDSQKKKLKQH